MSTITVEDIFQDDNGGYTLANEPSMSVWANGDDFPLGESTSVSNGDAINGGVFTVTKKADGTGFTATWPKGTGNAVYSISYNTKIKNPAMVGKSATFKNNASVNGVVLNGKAVITADGGGSTEDNTTTTPTPAVTTTPTPVVTTTTPSTPTTTATTSPTPAVTSTPTPSATTSTPAPSTSTTSTTPPASTQSTTPPLPPAPSESIPPVKPSAKEPNRSLASTGATTQIVLGAALSAATAGGVLVARKRREQA